MDAPVPQQPGDVLTVEEAAELLRVNVKTLYSHINLERPPWALRFGRLIRISRSALLDSFRDHGLEPSRSNRSVPRLETEQ